MKTPNIILMMCDDLGYGDTGFNGNEIIKTPSLDDLRAQGARFTRFYSGGPVCSPTRGTYLTGRHYSRYGITHANVGRLPAQEITIPRILKGYGYTNGHFGTWHLGTMEREYSGKPNRNPPPTLLLPENATTTSRLQRNMPSPPGIPEGALTQAPTLVVTPSGAAHITKMGSELMRCY